MSDFQKSTTKSDQRWVGQGAETVKREKVGKSDFFLEFWFLKSEISKFEKRESEEIESGGETARFCKLRGFTVEQRNFY